MFVYLLTDPSNVRMYVCTWHVSTTKMVAERTFETLKTSYQFYTVS